MTQTTTERKEEDKAQLAVIPIDQLRKLKLCEVCRRTGYSDGTISKLLAKDRIAGTPGRHFAAPMRRVGLQKLEWREVTLMRWMEEQEKRT